MIAACFADTNILVYAASNAPEDREKRQIARQLLARPDIGFSAQVLQEFYVVAVSKKHLQMTHDAAVEVLQSLSDFPVWPTSRDLVLEAVVVAARFGISYWDAAIVTAARQMGCHTLYTEDLNGGQSFDGLKITNPFALVP
jgi:predicted nucleic acid-binding protein